MYLLPRNRAWESWAPIKFLLHCTACQGILWAGNCRASTLPSQAQPGFKLFLVDICICIALEFQPCCPNAAPSVSLYRALRSVSNLEMSCASHAAEIRIDYQISKRYRRSERGKKKCWALGRSDCSSSPCPIIPKQRPAGCCSHSLANSLRSDRRNGNSSCWKRENQRKAGSGLFLLAGVAPLRQSLSQSGSVSAAPLEFRARAERDLH